MKDLLRLIFETLKFIVQLPVFVIIFVMIMLHCGVENLKENFGKK